MIYEAIRLNGRQTVVGCRETRGVFVLFDDDTIIKARQAISTEQQFDDYMAFVKDMWSVKMPERTKPQVIGIFGNEVVFYES